MLRHLRDTVSSILSRVEVRVQVPQEVPQAPPERDVSRYRESRSDPAMAEAAGDDGDVALAAPPAAARAPVRHASGAADPNNPSTWGKVARNAACPCGSGKKYKHCHGKLA